MGKTLIKVKCVDQRLLIVNRPTLASGGQNEDVIEFEFCPLWDKFEKVATFRRNNEEPYHARIVDGRCVIPHEVLSDEGLMYFGVLGVNGDITRTSEELLYPIVKGPPTDDTNPSDPTPSIYAQYVDRIVKLEERVEDIEKNGGGTAEGSSLPTGGKAGQILRKRSDDDGDVEWADFEIPQQYGLVTYDQDKTITIT